MWIVDINKMLIFPQQSETILAGSFFPENHHGGVWARGDMLGTPKPKWSQVLWESLTHQQNGLPKAQNEMVKKKKHFQPRVAVGKSEPHHTEK